MITLTLAKTAKTKALTKLFLNITRSNPKVYKMKVEDLYWLIKLY